MKKSQLRNIIREVIKEQGLKKLQRNPERGRKQIPNCHQKINMKICDCQPTSHPYCQNLFNQHIVNGQLNHTMPLTTNSNSIGFTCDGSMCVNQDIGSIFDLSHNSGYTLTYELLNFYTPQQSNNFRNTLPSTCPSVITGGCLACTGAAGEIPGCCDPTTITTNGDYGTGPQTISAYSNYDPNATCYNSQNQCQTITTGCTDPSAQNYNPSINNTGNVGPNLINGTTQTLSDNSTCIY